MKSKILLLSTGILLSSGLTNASDLSQEFAAKTRAGEKSFCAKVVQGKMQSIQWFVDQMGSSLQGRPQDLKGDVAGGRLSSCSYDSRVYIKLADGRVCLIRAATNWRGEMNAAFGSCQ